MKHLLLEIAGATEAAALAASAHVGSGDKIRIDEVATEAMRTHLNGVDFIAEIALGEGIKDGSIGLFAGERIGRGRNGKSWEGKGEPPEPHNLDDTGWEFWKAEYDVAVDPVDGTTQTAKGGYEAMSVIALGRRNHLFTTENFYMNKMAVGPEVVKYFTPDINQPVENTVKVMAQVLKKDRITVCMLDRPRHDDMASRLRHCGCRIKFIQDCDVSGAIATALPESGIDMFIGIGGAPEGVITAAALKCLGGHFQGTLVDARYFKPIEDRVLTMEHLAQGEVMFAATGITNGSLLNGIRFVEKGWITHSIIMHSSHKGFKKLESYHRD